MVAPTSGNFLVTIRGSNFGLSVPSVTIGGSPCIVATPFVPAAGHDTLTCIAPPGMGDNNLVSVTVSTLASIASVNSAAPDRFWYSPPLPQTITPSGKCIAEGGVCLKWGDTANPPFLSRHFIIGGPTSGRSLGSPVPGSIRFNVGPRIVCVVTGQSLGVNGTVEFRSLVTPVTVFVTPPPDVIVTAASFPHVW